MTRLCSAAKTIIPAYSKGTFSTNKYSLFNRANLQTQSKITLGKSGENLQSFLISLKRFFPMAEMEKQKILHEYKGGPWCFMLC